MKIGFAFSSLNDVETEGYANQYSVYNAKNNGNQFAVAYDGGEYGPVAFEFTDGAARKIKSFEVCNNTYAALSTKNGDAYAKKFEEDSGKNLSDFLNFISSIERKNSDLPSASV